MVFLGGVTLYAVGVLLVALMHLFRLEPTGIWALPNLFGPLLFAPLVFLVPLALGWRSSLLRGCTGLLVLLFFVQFGGLLVPPRPVLPPEKSVPVRVLSLNQLFSNSDLQRLEATLVAHDADIVALQELSPEFAEVLQERFKARYPYQVLRPSSGPDGLGVISHFPLRETYEASYRGQELTVRHPQGAFTLINLHFQVPFESDEGTSFRSFAFDPTVRNAQLANLVRAVAEVPRALVVGDFNLSDREPGYRRLAGFMTDAYRRTRSGFGMTFPVSRRVVGIPLAPLLRIDYIWARGLEPLSAARDCDSGSDHCALIAELALPRQ